jgi:pimeloyl-ACP methyl ester carboxylesterase
MTVRATWPPPRSSCGQSRITDCARRLPFISARTLVVHPAGDSLVPRAYAEEFARLIPGAQMTTIDSAGHMVMLERPEEFGAVLEKFLG